MPDYRLYSLDGTSHFTTVDEISANSDDEAIVLARAKRHPMKCELWSGDRLVKVLVPRQPIGGGT